MSKQASNYVCTHHHLIALVCGLLILQPGVCKQNPQLAAKYVPQQSSIAKEEYIQICAEARSVCGH
jgi:hypothetical protein